MRLALLLSLLCVRSFAADGTDVIVFEAKQNLSHPSVRIPSLLRTQKGALLAVAEGRDKPTDQAGNDLVISFSKDEGATWSKPRIAYEQGADSCNNPCLVQEAKSGRIFLFYQVFPSGSHEFGGLPVGPADPKGNRSCYVTSDDDGVTWSKPTDGSATLKPDEAITTASGPGIGIQLKSGPKAGRLVIPFNSQDAKKNFYNWVAYSDDAGATWKRGEKVPQTEKIQLNEVQVAESTGGGLYLNSRSWRRGPSLRKVSWSQDAGETWTQAAEDAVLTDPICQGSLLRLDDRTIAFLNAAGPKRANGTLRLTHDDGRTWASSRLTFPGPFAYSSMALLKDGRIGVLYEPASNTVVKFRAIDPAGR
jgi:sialidase-1